MIKKLIVGGACATLLTGCFQVATSQAPLATSYPLSEQQRMQAAHHWNVLAEHEAKLISASVTNYSVPLFIESKNNDTVFDKSFKNLLTSQLITKGVPVSQSRAGSAVVTYEVDAVHHKDRGFIRAPVGSWSLLAAGVAVTAHALHRWTQPAKLLVPAAIGADAFSGSWVQETDFEIIVTTQVNDNSRVTHSSSNIYYVNGGDIDHYKSQNINNTRTIQVTDQG